MAKLYMTCDTEKNSIHKIANQRFNIKVYYGSRDNSVRALTLIVEAPDTKDSLPTVFIDSELELKPIASPSLKSYLMKALEMKETIQPKPFVSA